MWLTLLSFEISEISMPSSRDAVLWFVAAYAFIIAWRVERAPAKKGGNRHDVKEEEVSIYAKGSRPAERPRLPASRSQPQLTGR